MGKFAIILVVMEKLYAALELIDSIDPSFDEVKIREILKKAYAISDDCLDALTLYTRFIDDDQKREAILVDALKAKKDKIDLAKDDIMTRQYMRMAYELCKLYIEIGKLPLALKLANDIYKLKGDIYDIKDVLYGLDAYFDRDKDSKAVTHEVKTLVDLIYAYERSDIDSAYKLRDELDELLPALKDVARGSEEKAEENDRVARLFRSLAYYIDRIPSVIYFLGEKR